MATQRTCRPINLQLAFFMLWILGWMLQLQGNGWVSLPSEECYTLQCLLKTQRHKLDCGCGGMHQGSRCLAFLFGLQQDSQHALRTTAVLIISRIWEDLGGVLLACVCSGSCCLWAVRHSLGAHPWGLPGPLCHATFARILWHTHSFQY